MSTAAGFIMLYCIATAVAIASRRLRMPYTVALLVTGLALGAMQLVSLPHLTRDLLFALFLPGLLFEASLHLHFRELRESALTIGLLAIPGVLLAILLTAFLLTMASPLLGAAALPWEAALVFGGVIAATDPVAVTALFREVSAPRRLHVLVESESLLNDGTSIVFLTLILTYIAGGAPSASTLAFQFVRVAAGGALIGLAVSWVATHVIRRIDDAAIEITITTIAAYGSFVAAEQLHCSGVIATVAAGVLCGDRGRTRAMSAETRRAVDSFWEWVAFALNSAVFLLLGAEVSLGGLAASWPLIVVGVLAVLAVRAVVVLSTAALVHRTAERLPLAWSLVLTWGGLRGALSLVLALALPETLVARSTIVTLTAGVVVASLIGQALTMAPLLARLGVGRASRGRLSPSPVSSPPPPR
jgi:CPA1 family monovalent cation:H+ antiporter